MENNEKNPPENNNKKCKVIIIGAGMAGLSAAYHLTKNGFNDFLLLEARKRIGGRIIQIKMGSEPVELGANWIHGILGNPVYDLAMQYGLVDIMQSPKPHRVIACTEAGRQVPFSTLQEIYEAYLCFLKRCEEYFFSQYSPPEGIDSVGDHIRLEASLYLDRINDPVDKQLREMLFDCLLKRETCISGCDDMNEIDLLELGTYTELQGGNITLPAGYTSILGPLSKEIPKENLLVEHPVNLIRWNLNKRNSIDNGSDSDDSDRTVVDEPLNNSSRESSCEKETKHCNVEVTCDNGTKFYADQIICTIPLGVLKHKADTLFQPPLPEPKREAIDKLLFGTVDKILLEYERPFLLPNITEILLLWEPDTDKPEGQEDLSKTWFKKIYSFTRLSDTIILGWISGKEAEYMEKLPNDVIKETCTAILRKFMNDPFIPKPKTVVCTSWYSQPYSRGSYTSIAVGASQVDVELLAQPLYADETETKPVVLFAGEHTHCNFYSTVHGAYLTGRTMAQVILSEVNANQDTVVDCEDTADLSSWIQSLSLE